MDEFKYNTEVRKYLQSKKWKDKKDQVLQRADNHCQLCYSNVNLEVHHNNYERIGNERESDLITLCKECHLMFHNYWKSQTEFSEYEIDKFEI